MPSPSTYPHYSRKYNIDDFQGAYHKGKVKHDLPVPGTAMNEDLNRRTFNAKRSLDFNNKIEGINQRHHDVAVKKGVRMRIIDDQSFDDRIYDNIDRTTLVLDNADPQPLQHKLNTTSNYVPSFLTLCASSPPHILTDFLNTGFPHINGTEPLHGNTALILAVKRGDVETVRVLLKFKADVEVGNDLGDKAINVAWRFWPATATTTGAGVDDGEVIKLTGDNKLDSVNVKEMHNRITLKASQLADLKKKTYDVIHLLLLHAASPNSKGGDGDTPLHKATANNQIVLVKLLLSFKAEVSISNNKNNLPIDLSIKSNYTETTRLLRNWESIEKTIVKHNFVNEWSNFVKDDSVHIVVPSLSAQRVIDDIKREENQSKLKQHTSANTNTCRFDVIDEIVSGPLDLNLTTPPILTYEKVKQMSIKIGRVKKHHVGNDHAKMIQRFINHGQAKLDEVLNPTVMSMRMSDREIRINRMNELIANKKKGRLPVTRLPKRLTTLQVPLDYYLTNNISGGFLEVHLHKKNKGLTKSEMIGESAKVVKAREVKNTLIRNKSLLRTATAGDGVKRSVLDVRRSLYALKVGLDGVEGEMVARPSTVSAIGRSLRKIRKADESEGGSGSGSGSGNGNVNRRDDIDKRILQRERLTASEMNQRSSAITPIDILKTSDVSYKVKMEAERRRDPVLNEFSRAQFIETGLLPSLPPSRNAKNKGKSENENDDVKVKDEAKVAGSKTKKKKEKYHVSTNVMQEKLITQRMSRIYLVEGEEPWTIFLQDD